MEVVYDEESYEVTDEMKKAFLEDGYVIVRNLFSPEEILQMIRNYDQGHEYHQYECNIRDSDDRPTLQTMWNFPGYDVFGMAARTQKMVETCSKLLGGEVYHYNSKIVMKPPKTGGQTGWRQDYGIWYNNYVIFPDLITAFIAVDPIKKENGCLQVLQGSHKSGRIEHSHRGGEVRADYDRVHELQNVCQLKYVEQEPGDVIFLHSNTLYKSDVNTSDNRRLAFLPAYNRRTNSPVKKGIHPGYSALDVVYNDAVLDCENYTDLSGKEFIDVSDLEHLKTEQNLDSIDTLKETVDNT